MLEASFLYFISLPLYVVLLFILLKKKIKFSKIFIYSLFYFYIVAVIGITLFPLPIEKSIIAMGIKHQPLKNNFIPLASIMHIISHAPFKVIEIQIGGNILLTMPFGFLVPLMWGNRQSFLKTFIAGLFFTFFIEGSQFLISSFLGYTYRIADVDDILLNTVGCILGYIVFKIFRKFLDFFSLKNQQV